MNCRIFALSALAIAAWLLALLATSFAIASCTVQSESGPLEPMQAKATFQLPDNLAIELVASEPAVRDPVAVAWDARGRMFVVEMGDYPIGPPSGRIKLLEDLDGDGVHESSRVFADGLQFPTSVLAWRDGLLVSAAPDIIFLKDTDGDQVADHREVLFTGFGEGNQQLRVNSLIWGIDNWVYAANGRSNGEVRAAGATAELPRATRQPVSIAHSDCRFRPDRGQIESAAGFTQHGHGFDDWGDRFIGWNMIHIRHVVMPQRYLERNPHLTETAAVEEISDHGSVCRVFPTSRTTPRFNAEPAGYMNASCGLTIYRGDWLPAEYRGNSFVCEPLSNLVHRDRLQRSGATFVARRDPSESNREFLASTDRWFRPVNLATGPDGALYVVDFYRAFIEHPAYVRDEVAKKTVDWREGSDRGRIWRIVPRGTERRRIPDLAALATVDLVAMLEHANGWHRDTAQRLIVERADRGVVAALEQLATTAKMPIAQIHALRTLDGLDALSRAVLLRALDDRDARVRQHAVQLAEPAIRQRDRQVVAKICELADDADAAVRFQVACSLGEAHDPNGALPKEVVTALVRVARQGTHDKWTRSAILSALQSSVPQFLRLLTHEPHHARDAAAGLTLLVANAAELAGVRGNPDEMLASRLHAEGSSDRTDATPWQFAITTGLLEGQRRAGRSISDWKKSDNAALTRLAELAERDIDSAVQYAKQSTHGQAETADDRFTAIRLLNFAPAETALPVLGSLLSSDQSPEMQRAAVRAIGQHNVPSAVDLLLEHWSQFGPSVRRAVIDALLSRRDRIPALVAALVDKRIELASFDPAQSELLTRLSDDAARQKLKQLGDQQRSRSRTDVLDAFQSAVELQGDRRRGAELFVKHCVTCHAIRDKGQRVGPDLASVAGRDKQKLLSDILDPNREVGSDSISFIVAMRDGRILAGLIAGETDQGITIRRAEGIDETVLRSQIEQLRSTGRSLMPEGFEQELTPQRMADLLEFLRHGEPPP